MHLKCTLAACGGNNNDAVLWKGEELGGQIRRHKKEEPEEQIFIGICPDRHPALREVRTGIPPGDMGKERQKEDRLEMLEPPDKRGKEMRRFRNAGRGRAEQGGHGSHPPHHKK